MSGHDSHEEGKKKTVGAGRMGDPQPVNTKKTGAIRKAFPKIVMRAPPSPPAGETPAGGDTTQPPSGEAGETFVTMPAVYQGKKAPKRAAATLPHGAAETPRGIDIPADSTATGEATRHPTGADIALSDADWTSSAGDSDGTDPPAADKAWRRPGSGANRPVSPTGKAPRMKSVIGRG